MHVVGMRAGVGLHVCGCMFTEAAQNSLVQASLDSQLALSVLCFFLPSATMIGGSPFHHCSCGAVSEPSP